MTQRRQPRFIVTIPDPDPLNQLRPVLELLLVALIGYLTLVAYLFVFQARYVFYPNMPGRALEATPERIGLPFEEVRISAADSVALHGWFVPARDSRGVLLFFHGNAGNISHRLDSIELFHRLGLDVMIIDYRGYGLSEGKPSEHGTYRDAEAAWRYLTERRDVAASQVVVLGRSLGGPIAAWVAAEHSPAALIVESAFSSVPDMAQEIYPFLPARWLARLKYDTVSYVRQANCPVLVVHSRDDELIPLHHGEKIFAGASEPREFLHIRGDHGGGFLLSRDEYTQGIASFLDKYLGSAP